MYLVVIIISELLFSIRKCFYHNAHTIGYMALIDLSSSLVLPEWGVGRRRGRRELVRGGRGGKLVPAAAAVRRRLLLLLLPVQAEAALAPLAQLVRRVDLGVHLWR